MYLKDVKEHPLSPMISEVENMIAHEKLPIYTCIQLLYLELAYIIIYIILLQHRNHYCNLTHSSILNKK